MVENDPVPLHVGMHPEAAVQVHELGCRLGNIPTGEVVRRGLILLDVFSQLGPHEELTVRDTRTGCLERLRFHWDGTDG